MYHPSDVAGANVWRCYPLAVSARRGAFEPRKRDSLTSEAFFVVEQRSVARLALGALMSRVHQSRR